MQRLINVPRLTPAKGRAMRSGALLAYLCSTAALAQPPRVHASFDLGTPSGGPFPSNYFTIPDSAQNTGVRVNLPLPDCRVRHSDCEDLNVINTLDGFNLQPRISIPFDGPIDARTVNSQSVFLIKLPGAQANETDGERFVGIDQIVWDPASNTVYATADGFLQQHTTYALLVTDRVADVSGRPVKPARGFREFLATGRGEYRDSLALALGTARGIGVVEHEVVSAAVFTTRSCTAFLEKVSAQLHNAVPQPADFRLGANGERTVFTLSEVTGITFNQQVGANPPRFVPAPVRIDLLNSSPGAVAQIAFGKYSSPDYQVHPGEFIPPIATRSGVPKVQSVNELYFDLYIPSGAKPAGGWPVALLGHGGGSNKFFGLPRSAASLAANGIASAVINLNGHGLGPLGTVVVDLGGGKLVTLPAGGRGIDQNGDGIIDLSEGRYAAPPRRFVLDESGGDQQNVIDLMQLVRVIQTGVDVDGDGSSDLDPSRIYFFGQSLGSGLGLIFLAVEPAVHAGVLISPGALPTQRLSPATRPLAGQLLAARVPSLIEGPGIIRIDGISLAPPYFNEDLPLRAGYRFRADLENGVSHTVQGPILNPAPGSLEIQKVLEWRDWAIQSGNSAAYAPYIRKNPLPGVPPKSIVIQTGRGDQTAPNPGMSAIARWGDLRDRITLYRNDLAFAEDSRIPADPHTFAFRLDSPIPLAASISKAVQQQMAVFFASDGLQVDYPQPARFFETPLIPPLPEDLGFVH